MTSNDKVYAIVTEQIINALDAGVVPWRKPWVGGTANAPRNLRGTNYRGINVFLLTASAMAAGYTSNVWLTFNQAKGKGWKVTKGSKSTVVVFWKWLHVKDESDDGTATRKTIPMLRYYRVFNIEQTDAPKSKHGIVEPVENNDEFEPLAAAEALVAGFEGAPHVAHGGGQACYSPSLDSVRMPEQDKFGEPAEYYSTLFHEFAHSTGHADRVSRDEITRAGITFGDHGYSKEELVAEFGAAFLCGVAGIEAATIENSASYIANWKKTLKGNTKLVVQAAARAQKAADWILGNREYLNHDESNATAA